MKLKIASVFILMIVGILFLASIILLLDNNNTALIDNFEECVAAGYPVLESYPEQCRTRDGRTFTKDISEELQQSPCYIGGCSSQVCSDQKNIITTCEYKEEYACYKNAKCERQTNGQCGWTETPELKECLGIEGPIEIIAQNLKIPWEVVFISDTTTLVTERPGNLVILKDNNVERIPIQGVYHVGEGGLLGMALHPDFSKNSFLYLYLTYKDGNNIKNKVERYFFKDETLSDKKVIIDNIPGSTNHNGGRIIFGPGKYLYITTGDSGNSELAQSTNSLAGKILRLNDDGTIPKDNPFKNAVYSYGHRNPQGLAFDDKDRLWATEHGRSGILSGFDELNLIEKGKNYGWPVIQGDDIKQGMESPTVHSGATKTWAPSGMAFLNGKLFFGGLRGQALYEVHISSSSEINFKEKFLNQFGRIRAVAIDSSGDIYITTSNTDGRGKPSEGDDKLIKINM